MNPALQRGKDGEPSALVEQPEEVLAVPALAQRLGPLAQLVGGEEAHAPGDLIGGADLEALASLDRPHEVGGVVEGVEGAGVEPRSAALEHLDLQAPLLEVAPVEVGDLELAAGRRLEVAGVVDD